MNIHGVIGSYAETFANANNIPFSGVTDETFTCSYRTHVQNIGWQDWVSNSATSGTSGKGLRLEAIEIVIDDTAYDVGIEYQTHVQNIGWQNKVSNGKLSGTSGKGLRLEAIRINLNGLDKDKFDVYYRVHAQNFGWMDWAKDGQDAGTAGFGYRLEAIQIVVVSEGAPAPGSTDRPFVSR